MKKAHEGIHGKLQKLGEGTALVATLKVHAKQKDLDKVIAIHSDILEGGLLDENVYIASTLMSVYIKCGVIAKAEEVFFSNLCLRDVISWNTIMSGYAQHGLGDEALKYYKQMQDEGYSPDVVTFICVLKACCSIGFLEIGEEIHAKVNMEGLLQKDVVLGTALVDMYAKSGVIRKAQEVFDSLPNRNVVTWNSLLTGYAQLGQAQKVIILLHKMLVENIVPDLVTFLVLLNACNHGGLVEEGQIFFSDMTLIYGLCPTYEHCSCMVDLLSGAGHFDQALELIEKVPSSDRLELWLSLLGACQKWANIELGEWTFRQILELGKWAFDQSIQLDEKCSAAYICMRNIYAAAGMHEEMLSLKLESSR